MSEASNDAALDPGRLAALLETLLPGNETWPGASELDLAASVEERVDMAEGHRQAIQRLLDSLPDGFEVKSQSQREAAVRPLAASDDFGVTLLVAYDAYYVHADVLALLEQRCGYVTRPPQPDGFELEPFDDSQLARARERKPFWRQA